MPDKIKKNFITKKFDREKLKILIEKKFTTDSEKQWKFRISEEWFKVPYG